MKSTIKIDGSFHEGGGQIVRTAVGLSCVLGKGVVVGDIRKGRPKPGLKNQHLKSIEFLGDVFSASTSGVSLGSERVEFIPGEFKGAREASIDLETAGSITLFLQTVTLALCGIKEKVALEIIGGTDVKWSPSSDYFSGVFLENLKFLGYDANYEVIKRGFYPKGNGKAKFLFNGFEMENHDFIKGKVREVELFVHSSKELERARVVERIEESFRNNIKTEVEFKVDTSYDRTDSAGVVATAVVKTTNGNYGADILGERGLSSEEIGKRLAERVNSFLENDFLLDEHMTDQILPFISLLVSRSGKPLILDVERISRHTETNIYTIRKFLDVEFRVERDKRKKTIKFVCSRC